MSGTQAQNINELKPSSDYGNDQPARINELFESINHPIDQLNHDNLLLQILSTHNNTVKNYDYSSLFAIVKNILERSTQILDEIILGGGSQPQAEKSQKNAPTATDVNFNEVPLCDLRQIACEIMSCDNQSGPEVAHKITMSILRKLSTYSWEAKAVLTLAAFAMEFGDFSWLFYQNQSHQSAESVDDQKFVKSLGTLKRVFVFANPSELLKRQPEVLSELKLLKDLIIAALNVIKTLFEVENLSVSYDLKGESAFPITTIVYWIIITVVACAATITSLTCDGVFKTQGLKSTYKDKMDTILEILTKRLKDLKEKEGEAKLYRELKKLLEHPTRIVEVFQAMFSTQENVVHLFDCQPNSPIEIEELTGKNIFLLISGLNISDDDIRRIEKIQDKIEEENLQNYKIVWIPIVENWTSENKKKYEVVRAKMKWYAMKSVSQTQTVGIKYIKEEWHFEGKTMFVVMNQQGHVENSDAYPVICLGGVKAFPFDAVATKEFLKEVNWLKTVVDEMDVDQVKEWINDKGSYIFLYGGRDEEWTKKFEEAVGKLKTNYSTIRSFNVGKTEKDNVNSKFWSGVENLYLAKVNNNMKSNVTSEEIHSESEITKDTQKLLSYKYEEGWVLFSEGSRPVKSGHGFIILKALENFNSKLEKGIAVIDHEKINFTKIFLECYEEAIKENGGRCCHLHIRGFQGKQLEEVKCAECDATMEMMIVYECCHKGSEMAAHRDDHV